MDSEIEVLRKTFPRHTQPLSAYLSMGIPLPPKFNVDKGQGSPKINPSLTKQRWLNTDIGGKGAEVHRNGKPHAQHAEGTSISLSMYGPFLGVLPVEKNLPVFGARPLKRGSYQP